MNKTVLILLLFVFISSSCIVNNSCPKQAVQTSLKKFDVINISFGERTQLFIDDEEMLNPMLELNSLKLDRESFSDLEIPACLEDAKEYWLEYADLIIDAFDEVLNEGIYTSLENNIPIAIDKF